MYLKKKKKIEEEEGKRKKDPIHKTNQSNKVPIIRLRKYIQDLHRSLSFIIEGYKRVTQ